MKKLELLAPAGSKEAGICAVEAGADAVYCGLQNFSARSKAQNFTRREFFNFADFAHKKNVKVYAAFNTLIKQNETEEAAKELNFLSQAGADAVIVQDFGAVWLAKKYFPRLKIHASTQMSIHNSYGVLQAKKEGIKRVVLARELSLEEIKIIASKTQAKSEPEKTGQPNPGQPELEIFCHGALCFSVSGLCLMSSFIGGYSANRGCCAQPCRRLWSLGKAKGFYISPKDLDLSQYISELKTCGVASLKIEGRMKSPQYVYKTVKAYRTVIDDASHASLEKARKILAGDFARNKTSFNFIKKSEDIFQPETSKQTGVYLGKILSYKNGILKFKSETEINDGDILKAADVKNDAYHKIKVCVSGAFLENGVYSVPEENPALKAGMDLFKVSDAGFQSELNGMISKARICKDSVNVKEFSLQTPKFAKPASNGAPAKETLFIKIDDMEWLKLLKNRNQYEIILSLNEENVKKAQDFKYCELPPYIEEPALPLFQKAAGKNCFINNIGHFQFFENSGQAKTEAKREASLLGGSFLYALNAFAAEFIMKNKIKDFVCTAESDFQNISELAKTGLSGRMIFYLSGFPNLAVSLMSVCRDLKNGGNLQSEKDALKIINKNGKTIVLPKYPITLFNKKEKLQKLGINKFLIDLSFIKPNDAYLKSVIDAYNGKSYVSNACEFNFERKLK